MKNILFLFAAILFFGACQPATEEMPTDMAGLKALQKEKKAELKTIQDKLDEIQTKMIELDPTMFEKPKKLVTGLSLAKSEFKRYLELQGSVLADETVYVSSETGGRIIQLNVKEGERVGKGKLIARVDLESLDKQIAEVDKSLELARDIYKRQSRLWDQKIGTEIQYLQAKNNVERLEQSIETLKHQRAKANVYSPISGEVAMVNKENGEVAGPGEPIATLLNTRKLKITVDVPENLLPVVNRGDLVDVKIPAINYEKKHRIKRIGTQISPTNRTIPVEVEIYNGNGKIKPNLLATMLINDFNSEDAIVVPNTLLQQEVSGKYFVYTIQKIDDVDQVVKKYVEPGESYAENIVILDGLSESDIIIDKGSRQVADGDHLTVESVEPLIKDAVEQK